MRLLKSGLEVLDASWTDTHSQSIIRDSRSGRAQISRGWVDHSRQPAYTTTTYLSIIMTRSIIPVCLASVANIRLARICFSSLITAQAWLPFAYHDNTQTRRQSLFSNCCLINNASRWLSNLWALMCVWIFDRRQLSSRTKCCREGYTTKCSKRQCCNEGMEVLHLQVWYTPIPELDPS